MQKENQLNRLTILEEEKLALEKEIAELKEQRDKKAEEDLDLKIRVTAMEEITRCSKESLFRHMGYVKSFYDD